MKSLVVILTVQLSVINWVSSKHHAPEGHSKDDHGIDLDEEGFLKFMDVSRTKAREFARKQELLAYMLKEASYNVGPSDINEGLAILNSCMLDDVDDFLMGMLTALWNGSHIDRVSQHLQPCGKLVTYVLDSSWVTLDKREAAKHFANDLRCMAVLSREVFWYTESDGPLRGDNFIEAVVRILIDVIRLHRAAVELDWAAHVAFGKDHVPAAGKDSHINGHSEDHQSYKNVPNSRNNPTKKNKSKDDYLKMLVRNLMTSLSRSRSPRSVDRQHSQESHLRNDVFRAIVDNIRNVMARGDSDSTSKESSSEREKSRLEHADYFSPSRNSQRSSVDGRSSQRSKKNYLKKLLGRLLSRSSEDGSETETEYTTSPTSPSSATTMSTTEVFSNTSPKESLDENIATLEEILCYLKKVKHQQYQISAIEQDGVVQDMVGDLYYQLLSTKDGLKITLVDEGDVCIP